MTWSKGDPWRVVESLQTLNRQIRAAYPNAVPPATPVTSWGSIADSAHSTSSDHYPHEYAALGMVAVVCARDFPHAPALGLDFGVVAEQLRRSKDPRIKYVIFNGRMFSSYATSSYAAWTWRPYSGKDMHTTHGHISTVHTAAADDPRPWQIGEDDMGLSRTEGLVGGRTEAQALADLWWAAFKGNSLAVEQQALRRIELGQQAVLAAVQGLDTAAVLARIDQHAEAEAQRDAELAALVQRGLSGEVAAEEVVRLIGEKLAAAQ